MRIEKPTFESTCSFLARNRVRFTTILVIFLVLENVLAGIKPHDLDSLQDPLGFSGLLLVLVGLLIRSWAAGMIHKGEQLSTRGPYSLIRHPLYTGSLCMALGFCLIIGDNINLPTILVAGFLLYAPTIRKEERELASKFGPLWQDYAQKTGVLLPKKISADIFSKWHLPQWFKNREYRAMTVGLTALALLELLHELPVSTTFLAGG